MNKKKLLISTIAVIQLFLFSFHIHSSTQQYHPVIKPYVEFLQKGHSNPVDYVMNLFEDHDLVIICERWHAETTQYDFIYSLVSDKRFIKKVGNVFTELGTRTLNPFINKFMSSKNLSKKEVIENIKHIFRNFCAYPFWEKYNYYDFLEKIYWLNNSLNEDTQLNLYSTDIPILWKDMTEKKYLEYKKEYFGKRDIMMADFITNKFLKIKKSESPRKKALIIMNYRHAFNDNFKYADGRNGDNCGRYLFERFRGKIANVLLNTLAEIWEPKVKDSISGLIQNGKWDASFLILKNPALGFNFPGSAFGDDDFDYFPFRKQFLTYKDIFTGFIFYKPLTKHKMVWGTPGWINEEFAKEIERRYIIAGYYKGKKKMESTIKKYNKITSNGYLELKDYLKVVNQWIDNSPKGH